MRGCNPHQRLPTVSSLHAAAAIHADASANTRALLFDDVITSHNQFHPEKSGAAGLELFRKFLALDSLDVDTGGAAAATKYPVTAKTQLAPRVIACLDVRSNDAGDLVVTKGDNYDVREKGEGGEGGDVRNLGKPVTLAENYYTGGADEVTFLNITSFRNQPMKDQPLLEVLRQTSRKVFVRIKEEPPYTHPPVFR